MVICDSLMLTLILFMSILFCVEDFKKNKIYNKWVLPLFCLGVITHILLVIKHPYAVKVYLLSLLLITIISLLLYYFEIWAGGDSKLVISLSACIPFWCLTRFSYYSIIYLLVIIFSISFIYLIGESVYLTLKNEEHINTNRVFTLNTALRLLIYSGFYSLIQVTESYVFGYIYVKYGIFFYLANIFVLLFIRKYDHIFNKKIIAWCLCAWGGYILIKGFILGNILRNILFVSILFTLRWFAEKYNYKEIKTEDVKEGMVLSYMTVLSFQKSRVKGLPSYTLESIKTRITADEAESIQRWRNSKYGSGTIVIVRKLPFAIFICIGFITFLGIGVFL